MFSPRDRSGYTLLEVLIVAAIIAFLSGTLILYGSAGRRQAALSIEAQKVVQVISRAKALAVEGFTTPDAPCGYGVRADVAGGRYVLFSYKDTNCDAITSIQVSDNSRYREMESYPLINGVVFQSCPDAISEVLFIPPDPQTLLFQGGALSGSGSGTLCFGTSDGQGAKNVTVSSAGQITL